MDKIVKKEFKILASKDPDKYYPTKFLKELEYKRYKCSKCNTFFWSTKKIEICGDPSCCGGFSFFEDTPVKKKLSYVETWKEFSKHMENRGYTSIPRYPVVARWREDTDFVQASIYNFQPYVVSGEVSPPANPLVVPQICLRFNDIDNVGITMSHFTAFTMIGQHTFVEQKDWNQTKYFEDLYTFFTDVLGITKDELIVHEDAWAGGGNHGPCMEIFCRGVELANQVYMMFEHDEDGKKELKLKVLDMGMGHERVTWFSRGEESAYDAVFPNVMETLYKAAGIKKDNDFLKKYMPSAAYLNLDEVEDMNKAWEEVSKKVGLSVDDLKAKILPLRELYSVAEHARCLLFAISDGALPSNVKGGYNLRTLLRRAQSFIEKNNWNIKLEDVCELHAKYLHSIFPETQDNIEHVKKIIRVEVEKYFEAKKRSKRLIENYISKKKVSVEDIVELYDSHGINPDDFILKAKENGINIALPSNFYSLVTERHEQKEQKTKTSKKVVNDELLPTNILYYEHFDLVDFKANVLKVIGDFVLLDKTAFYPTSGGQIHDTGKINEFEVLDVLKQGNSVLHKVKNHNLKEGDVVNCKVDFNRREQVTQHHTATHILTGSVRQILGKHVWQAGAAKTEEKGRLDITHYESLSDEELKLIEGKANEVVRENRPIYKRFMTRNKAEKAHGITIYQGGAVPGNNLRIVEIEGFDVEACGGTHVDLTGDVSLIKIIKTSKIQDGVLRLEFVAGKKAVEIEEKQKELIKKAKELLDCNEKQIPLRAKELFDKWKQKKKGKINEIKLESTKEFKGDILQETANILKTQPEHIIKTIEKFLR
ncbi:MAG: alanine--tRNA ligase [Candidatus Woesearchaeota archaeon]